MMCNVTLKNSFSQQESVYLIHLSWLLKNRKEMLTTFEVLPGAKSHGVLMKCQVCIQRNQ